MNATVLTASGQVKAESGQLLGIHVTKVGTGASSIIVHDSPDIAGAARWQGDGLVQQAFNMPDDDEGIPMTKGIYVELAGTTAPTVVVFWE